MLSFTILPVLGIRNNVPPDSPEMFEYITDSIARAHCADSDRVGYSNVYVGQDAAANKTGGRSVFLSTDATLSGTLSTLLLYQHHQTGKSNVTYLVVSNGAGESGVYYYTSGSSVAVLSNGAGNESFLFESAGTNPSIMQVGDYIILNDEGAPNYAQCVKAGSTVVSRLEGGASPIIFREVIYFRNRMFAFGVGANTNAIRYSNLNPTLPDYDTSIDTNLSFSASNEIFYPDLEAPTGGQEIDKNRLIVYSDRSISEIKYLPNYASPFSITKICENFGAISNDCIVTIGGKQFFYDKTNGFCSFDGYSPQIISNTIKDVVDSISPITRGTTGFLYYSVKGTLLKYINEIAWTTSTNGTTNNIILYYNYITGAWRKDSIAARTIASGYRLDNDLYPVLFLANDAVIYHNGFNASDAGASYTAYRVEPVLNFGGMRKSLILGIWFNHVRYLSSGSINVYYRGGNTLGQTTDASWTLMGIMHAANADYNIVRPLNGVNVNNRYHQIKWGTEASSDLFSVREIKFDYVLQGMY